MKVEIIYGLDQERLVESVNRFIKFVLPDFINQENEYSLYFVDQDVIGWHENNQLERIENLITATNANNLIIILGYAPLNAVTNSLIQGLLSYTNVGYLDVFNFRSLPSVFTELTNKSKQTDQISLSIFEHEKFEQKITHLKHGMEYKLENFHSKKMWLEEARRLGFDGDDENIIDAIRNWKTKTVGLFAGECLDGIFVDAFETLFDRDWQLVPQVKKAVEILARAMEKNIYIISDSDSQFITTLLKKSNINWRFLSKFDLRGAELEIVIDNLSADQYTQNHSINFKRFINVNKLVN